RLDQPGWATADFAAADWRAAKTIGPPPGLAIDPQRCPPIRVRQVMRPQALRKVGAGHYLVDFGQNFAGWPRLSVSAPAGSQIVMRFAEMATADGRADQSNLRTARARDVYICAGTGREVWEPRFTYHGFRYVEVSGVPDDPAAWSLEGLVGHQDLAETGEFRCGDAVVEKFWRNSLWSQRSNFFGLPTDCPQRDERLGWMGDAEVFWPAAAYAMDVQAFTARVMEDMRAGQKASGGFPDCIPPYVPGMNLSSPGWADAGVVLPYTTWRQSGDSGVIAANWNAMERYLAGIEKANPTHLWEKARGADFGDWLAIDAPTINPGYPTTPKDLIGTAFWAEDARMMAEMAAAIGSADAAQRYRDLFAAIRAAFNAAYAKPDGAIGNGSQTGYVLAIRFGLLDPVAAGLAGQHLVSDITRRGGHLSTGFLGTPHILDALTMTGQELVAIGLLVQRSYPSWGYMVEQGATTMWERWNSDQGDKGMNSRNHYAFGAIGSFLFRRVAGIEALEPGFTRIRVAPLIDARLGSGGATYRSASGPIRTDWSVKNGHYRLDVEVPAAVAAEVHLPQSNGTRHIVKARPGLNRFTGALAG
ncbi:MAG: family 78 glycoside hydrolase catalytic domain, partial [Sphingomonadales bacterium]|nr:family 78 glycoside hydrolase catalytic domain [Sphingomonadales bacterium]